MKIFKKHKIRKDETRIFELFGFPLFSYKSVNKKMVDFKFFNGFVNLDNPVFYLKVNRQSFYTIKNLKLWIDIAREMDYDFFIICDSKNLKQQILREVGLTPLEQVRIIKSCKNSFLKKIVSNIASKGWINATYAHLTVFWHSHNHNIKSFWNIDADDTTICLDKKQIVKCFKEIEKYATDNKIGVFSLDMWVSKFHNQNWSFGITYTNNEIVNWLEVLSKNNSTKWQSYYSDYFESNYNIDLFFRYLQQYKGYNIKSFYLDNTYFIHWGKDFLTDILASNIYLWENDFLKLLNILNLYNDKELGLLPIPESCVKFNTIEREDFRKFMYDKFLPFRFDKVLAKNFGISKEHYLYPKN